MDIFDSALRLRSTFEFDQYKRFHSVSRLDPSHWTLISINDPLLNKPLQQKYTFEIIVKRFLFITWKTKKVKLILYNGQSSDFKIITKAFINDILPQNDPLIEGMAIALGRNEAGSVVVIITTYHNESGRLIIKIGDGGGGNLTPVGIPPGR